jgi:hypothetical protein
MATDLKKTKRKPNRDGFEPEPAWDIARLFPAQGQWSEEDYLELDTNRLVELSDGFIEVLPIATTLHHLIAVFLFDMIRVFAKSVTPKLGTALIAPDPSVCGKTSSASPTSFSCWPSTLHASAISTGTGRT